MAISQSEVVRRSLLNQRTKNYMQHAIGKESMPKWKDKKLGQEGAHTSVPDQVLREELF